MDFVTVDLGQVRAGAVVHIEISGTECNVMLLDGPNFDHYRRGEGYSYVGLFTKTSPVNLGVPHTGTWHVVGDLGGGSGQLGMTASVID